VKCVGSLIWTSKKRIEASEEKERERRKRKDREGMNSRRKTEGERRSPTVPGHVPRGKRSGI
jgi:hypothetical protein